MAKKHYVNLLEEFQGVRNCDLIILTTYSFDSFFFDHMILRELKENNPDSDIIVLVDAEHVNIKESYGIPGVEYCLLPLPSTFHPKLFIFCSEKSITTFIGSHNLTLAGFTHNLELSCRITNREISGKCLEYVISILSQFLGSDHELLGKIARFVGQADIRASDRLNIQFLHNLNSPILSKVIEKVKDENAKIHEVSIIAPFFSSVREQVEKIKRETRARKINLCIQLNNHNLDVDSVEDLPYIDLLKAEPKEQRRIHCKIVLFQSKRKQFILMGSPNFTKSAMLEVAKPGGNYEAGVLVQQTSSRQILSELRLSKVSKKEARETMRVEVLEKRNGTPVHLILAEYRPLELEIQAIASKPISNARLNIKPLKEDAFACGKPLNIDPHENSITISLAGELEIGSSIWLSLDKRRISNKIPVSMPRQRMAIELNRENLRKVSAMIGGSRTLSELLQIMLRLFPLDTEATVQFPSSSATEGSKHGLIYKHKYSRSLLDTLEKLFRTHHNKTIRRPVGRNSFGKLSLHHSEKSLRERIPKILDRFAQIFKETRLKIDCSSSLYCLFLLLSVKICEKLCSFFHLYDMHDAFLTHSLSNFESMFEENGVSGSTMELLSLLLYLEEEMGCRINPYIMENVAKQSGIAPTSLINLVEIMESRADEIKKALDSMSLHLPEERCCIYSSRVGEFAWAQANDLQWRALTDREKLVTDLATECFSLMQSYNSVPFDILLRAARGEEMALSELQVYYDRWPVVSGEGYPLFEVNSEHSKEIVRLASRRILSNMQKTLQDTKTEKLSVKVAFEGALENLIEKEIRAILFSAMEKNQRNFANFGKLFEKIDPKRSQLTRF